jgi:hypothetical protein
MQHAHAFRNKRQMVVTNAAKRAGGRIAVGKKRRCRTAFEEVEGAHARFDGGEVLVCPVRGGEVGGDVWVCGAEEVEEEEEGYLVEGGAVFVEFCGHGVGGEGPLGCEGSALSFLISIYTSYIHT